MKLLWEPSEVEGGLDIGYGYDPSADEIVIVQRSDATAVLKANKRRFNDSDPFSRRTEDWHHVACIPPGVAMKWKLELGVDILKDEDWPKVCRLLHDPDYRYLRTHNGNYMRGAQREFVKASTASLPKNARRVLAKIGAKNDGRVRRKGGI